MINSEMRLEIFRQSGYTCELCGMPLTSGQPQLAHRIPKTITNLRRYGVAIIDHPLNLAPTCSLRCNSAAIRHNHEERDLVARIREALDEAGDR